MWARLLTNRVPNEKDQKVIRFVGRTNVNIILTLSRPIRVSESYFLKILSFPPQGRQKERVIGQCCFHFSSFFVEIEIDVLLKRGR